MEPPDPLPEQFGPDRTAVPVSLVLADCDAWDPAEFAPTLSPPETLRAARYRRGFDRGRFVVRRGLLRRVLGERLGIPAAEVPLAEGPHGKPFVAADAAGVSRPVPPFNLARTGGLVLIAWRTDTPRPPGAEAASIGVDLERTDTDRRAPEDFLRLAGHFSREEREWLAALPSRLVPEAFTRLWTCKEACLKCLGTGIGAGVPLAEVAAALRSDGTLGHRASAPGGLSWSLGDPGPPPGLIATVAVPFAPGGVRADLRTVAPRGPAGSRGRP